MSFMTPVDAWCFRVADIFEPDPPVTLAGIREQVQLDAPALDAAQREDLADIMFSVRDHDPDPLDVARRAEIIELAGKTVLWFSDGDELRMIDLPEDGGPGFGKCAVCAAWLCVLDPDLKGGVLVCTGSYHSDAELEALGFEI